MESKDSAGRYYVAYVVAHPPRGVDGIVWSVAVEDYLRRNGVDAAQTTAQTTVANVDWSELRRTYNRLLGEGKQRRNADSAAAPGRLSLSDDADAVGKS